MEQSEVAESLGLEAPQEPIIVLGKQNEYLIIALTVEQAVEDIRLHLSPSGDDQDAGYPKKRRPGLDELDFFDAAGWRLEPVVAAGQLESLVLKNYQEEIRNRIRMVYYMNRGKAREENPNADEVTPPPADTISFEDFLQRLARESRRLRAAGCDIFKHWWGHC